MGNSSIHFYSTLLYINHWIINSEKQLLEQRLECRIPFSRLVIPETAVNIILLSLNFSQSFDSQICCSVLLSGTIWTGKMKNNQNLVFRDNSGQMWNVSLPLKWRKDEIHVSLSEYSSPIGYFIKDVLHYTKATLNKTKQQQQKAYWTLPLISCAYNIHLLQSMCCWKKVSVQQSV